MSSKNKPIQEDIELLRQKKKNKKTTKKIGADRRARIKQITDFKEKISNRSSGEIISNKWMYLTNRPLNFQAEYYAIQKLREKHLGDYYDSKYIKTKGI